MNGPVGSFFWRSKFLSLFQLAVSSESGQLDFLPVVNVSSLCYFIKQPMLDIISVH